MIIKCFRLASADDELSFGLSGGFTIGMPCKNNGVLPFGVFPQRGLFRIELGDVTVFSGSVGSVKNLLIKVIVSKLIALDFPKGMDSRCLEEYLHLCTPVYCDFAHRNEYTYSYISRELTKEYIDNRYANFNANNKWSMLQFYDKEISGKNFVIVEEPESFLSLEELGEFAEFVKMTAECGQCQFLISSNSPIMRCIKHAALYDFDSQIYKITARKGYI